MYYKSILRSIRYYQVNLVIKILILSDFLVWSSYQLLAPIFALFITDKIHGSIEVVGIASAIYLITKSVCEIPVGAYIDRSKSERDDLYTALAGTFLTALVYFLYIFINSVWQLYTLQILMGVSAALAFPGWYAIFTRHVDEGKTGLEWSLYDVLLGVGMAGAAALGGFLAGAFGFNVLFALVGLFTIFGSLLLLVIKSKIVVRPRRAINN